MSAFEVRPVDNIFIRTLYQRAIVGGRPGSLPLWVAPEVLERYVGQAGVQMVRTDSAGRLKVPGLFALEFGIPPGGGPLQVSVESMQRLPQEHLKHFLDHLVAPQMNVRFCQMQLQPGSCFDDGEIRPYEP